MDVYGENILDHYRHPRGQKKLSNPDIEHEEANHSCGDRISVEMKMNGNSVDEIGWTGDGCAISQAAMSMLMEDFPDDIEQFSPKEMIELLEVPIGARRTKCALLGLHALKNAMRKSKGEKPLGWTETLRDV